MFFIAIFWFCATVGVMETQLVETNSDPSHFCHLTHPARKHKQTLRRCVAPPLSDLLSVSSEAPDRSW